MEKKGKKGKKGKKEKEKPWLTSYKMNGTAVYVRTTKKSENIFLVVVIILDIVGYTYAI